MCQGNQPKPSHNPRSLYPPSCLNSNNYPSCLSQPNLLNNASPLNRPSCPSNPSQFNSPKSRSCPSQLINFKLLNNPSYLSYRRKPKIRSIKKWQPNWSDWQQQ